MRKYWLPGRPTRSSAFKLVGSHTPHGRQRSRGGATRFAQPDPKLIRLLALCHEQAVGYVDLYGDDIDARELGYLIAPASRWGQGLGIAAARAGLQHGFEALGLRRIWAEAIEANTASVRVLQRLGMDETGPGEAEEFLGQASRYVQFEMLRSRWAAGLTTEAP